LWRDKQLRDYRKANNLYYHCGDKVWTWACRGMCQESQATH
jgi:hypothetical protein